MNFFLSNFLDKRRSKACQLKQSSFSQQNKYSPNDIAPGVVEDERLNIVDIENHAPANRKIIVSSPISGLCCAQTATYAVYILILCTNIDIAEDQKGKDKKKANEMARKSLF